MSDDKTAIDHELILRTAKGETAAFRLLVDRHAPAVLRYARALTESREDAEDIMQETFLAALRSAGRFRGEASVKTWLFVIARNSALRLRRNASRSSDGDGASLEELGAAAGFGSEDPESLAIRAQNRRKLAGALESLRTEDREILLLRDLEGLAGQPTAEMLGLTMPAMKSRLHRARLKLAAALRAGGEHDF